MAKRIVECMAKDRDMPVEAAQTQVNGFILQLKCRHMKDIEDITAIGSAGRKA